MLLLYFWLWLLAWHQEQNFMEWLANQTSQSTELLDDTLRHALEEIFDDLESQYGAVTPENLDPRHVYMFLIEK